MPRNVTTDWKINHKTSRKYTETMNEEESTMNDVLWKRKKKFIWILLPLGC